MARRAEVSTGMVSTVLNRPGRVAEQTRLRVLNAIEELGYVGGGVTDASAPRHRRNGFVQAATSIVIMPIMSGFAADRPWAPWARVLPAAPDQ